jgi:putative ABC transport system substrate-binding protein
VTPAPRVVATRRTLLRTLLLAATRVPAVSAQPAGGAPRIGWLTSSVVHTRNAGAFREAMRALGHRDAVIEFRAAAGRMEELPALAAELLGLNVDVIVTDGGPAAIAAARATSTIPIVIGATAADLVRQGLVASLARPGGNVTGFLISTGPELNGKRLELLREALPALTRVAVLWNPGNPDARTAIDAIEAAARTLGIRTDVFEVRDAGAIDRAWSAVTRARVGAVVTAADAFLWSERVRIVSGAARHRLPGMYPEIEFAEAGGLMAYGPNVAENFRRAAGYVDRILKGTRPADLPVEQPATFELVVNARTARTLGVTLPPALLLRVHRVVE